MKVFEVAKSIIDRLTPKYGQGEARAMMRLIFENEKGWSPVDIAVKSNEDMTDFMTSRIGDVVDRLLKGEPIQYIYGNASFYGMNFKVTCDTLIPRPETAELVDIIVKENPEKDLRVIDMGTGSGCIAIALARNLAFADVTATDVSDKALAVARENGNTFKAGVNFLHADILKGEPSGEVFDIIVSNPPYITEKERSSMEENVLEHEPESALFVPDNDPLKFYKAILAYAGDALSQSGKIYFEINPLFADELRQQAVDAGFSGVELMRDSFGKIRFARITRNAD